jgi:hypothetical protein
VFAAPRITRFTTTRAAGVAVALSAAMALIPTPQAQARDMWGTINRINGVLGHAGNLNPLHAMASGGVNSHHHRYVMLTTDGCSYVRYTYSRSYVGFKHSCAGANPTRSVTRLNWRNFKPMVLRATRLAQREIELTAGVSHNRSLPSRWSIDVGNIGHGSINDDYGNLLCVGKFASFQWDAGRTLNLRATGDSANGSGAVAPCLWGNVRYTLIHGDGTSGDFPALDG